MHFLKALAGATIISGFIGFGLVSCKAKPKTQSHGPIVIKGTDKFEISRPEESHLVLKSGRTRITLKILSSEFPKAVFQKLLRTKIDARYSVQVAPYPGMITTHQNCEPGFISKPFMYRRNNLEFDGTEFFASPRYAEGVCHSAEIGFRVYRGVLACDNVKPFLEFEIFEPFPGESQIKAYLEQLQCEP